ncbi:GlsB/YeaQ/YmgE family stress response membrane protein [Candidatus Saccharibacteria bacterium]|nr:GlsB/YeaQ/YmgE family stress response membrane protein [Candidatus Saccharibacteria bacterium]
MSLIITIILGGIIGYVASKLMGREEGIIVSVIIGIVGSFIGGFISTLLTNSDKSYLAFSWMGLFWSLIGSVILVAILNKLSSPRHHHA